MLKMFKGSHGWMFLSGLLAGLGIMLITTTVTAEPSLKCTWPEPVPSVSTPIET